MKLQDLIPFLKSDGFVILVVVIAVVASCVSGLLWPAAAILSSIITIKVQSGSNLQSQQRQPCKDEYGDERDHLAKDTQMSQASPRWEGDSDGRSHDLTKQNSDDIIATDSKSEIHEGTISVESEAMALQSASGTSVPFRPDHLELSLARSEGADWGFAWQVGACAAKRLIIANISTDSPMDLCNSARQMHGLSTLAAGDELIQAGTHSSFDSLQEALRTETSLQLLFLKAHAVPRVIISAATLARSKQKKSKELDNGRCGPLVQPPTNKKPREPSKESSPADTSFDMVVNTKNTFIELRMTENDNMDRFARSDPIPLLSMRTILPAEMERVDEVEIPHRDAFQTSTSTTEEIAKSAERFPHYDTMDIHDVLKGALKLKADGQNHQAPEFQHRDAAGENVGVDKRKISAPELPHYDTMDLRDSFEEERDRCFQMAKETQSPTSVTSGTHAAENSELLNLETMDIHDFVMPSRAAEIKGALEAPGSQVKNKNPTCSIDRPRGEPLRIETSLFESIPDFLQGSRSGAFGQTLAYDFRSGFARVGEALTQNAQVNSKLWTAPGSLDISLDTPSYANSFIDSPKKMHRPGSEILGTRPCNISPSAQRHSIGNCISPSQPEVSSKRFATSGLAGNLLSPTAEASVAECFYIPPSSQSIVQGSRQLQNSKAAKEGSHQIFSISVDSNESAQIVGSSTDTYVPRHPTTADLAQESRKAAQENASRYEVCIDSDEAALRDVCENADMELVETMFGITSEASAKERILPHRGSTEVGENSGQSHQPIESMESSSRTGAWRPSLRMTEDDETQPVALADSMETPTLVGVLGLGPQHAQEVSWQPPVPATSEEGSAAMSDCEHAGGCNMAVRSAKSNIPIARLENQTARYEMSNVASVPADEVETKRFSKAKALPRQDLTKMIDDWYCPACFDLQFRANAKCRICGLAREHGVTELIDLDANKFLLGHHITASAEKQFRNLTPELQQAVMSGGSLHGARDPTAVLSNRMRKAQALASRTKSLPDDSISSQGRAPITLGFDRKKTKVVRQFPAGGAPIGSAPR